MASWLDVQVVASLTGRSGDDLDAPAFKGAMDAAIQYVERRRADLFAGEPPVFQPGPDVVLGTAMLAVRWYERRSSPLGVAQYSEFGGSMLRYDPDIARLLGIGAEGGFFVGGARNSRAGA